MTHLDEIMALVRERDTNVKLAKLLLRYSDGLPSTAAQVAKAHALATLALVQTHILAEMA